MTARNQSFSMKSGDSKNLPVTVKDPDGSVVPISGASIRWVLVDKSGSPILSKSTGDGIEITDAEGGEFTIDLKPEETEDLMGRYRHEAELTDANGNVGTILTGMVSIGGDLVE